MKMTRIVLAGLAIVAVAAAQDVTYNFDQTADFAKFKTYKWVEIPGGVRLDDLTSRQLTFAVEAGLATKGLTKVDIPAGYGSKKPGATITGTKSIAPLGETPAEEGL
jgi:hypothetical protein